MPKKKFIDKKHAVTFQVVHRSQKDPMINKDEVSQRVLLRTDKDQRVEEQIKFGVYYDDDYNYLQHLKESKDITNNGDNDDAISSMSKYGPNELVPSQSTTAPKFDKSSISLPSSVFKSNHETKIGLLNQAAPVSSLRLDLDPELVAAMDDDFDFDDPNNQLDEDFVVEANQNLTDVSSDDISMDDDSDVDNDFFDEKSFGAETFKTARSKFTDYSVTSSVMRRNNNLSTLDDRFDQFFEEYDNNEIGALDHEDINGYLDDENPVIQEALRQYDIAAEYKKRTLKDEIDDPEVNIDLDNKNLDSDEELIKLEIAEDDRDKWDCETILSTYSTIYNNPKVINDSYRPKKIFLSKKLHIPLDSLSNSKKNRALNEKNEIKREQDVICSRNKNETAEEKRERKNLVKLDKQKRRQEKKESKNIFKTENLKQQNQFVCQGMSSIKIL